MFYFVRTIVCALLLVPLAVGQDLVGPSSPLRGTKGPSSLLNPCGKANSCGIVAGLTANPTTLSIGASGHGTFDVTASPVPAAPNLGLLLYNHSGLWGTGRPVTPWGTLCLKSPFFRVSPPSKPIVETGKCAPASHYVFDFGTYIQTHAGMLGIVAGQQISFQAWYRDPDLASDPACFTLAVGSWGLLP